MDCPDNTKRAERITDAQEFKRQFHKQLASLPSAFRIMEYMPDIMFFMKDTQGRITAASHNFAMQMGGQCEDDILGRDAFDLCPRKLAEQYTEDDQQVMREEKPLVRHLELVQGPDSETGWFITHKIPLYDRKGKVIGLAGLTRSVSESKLFLQPYDEFAEIMHYIRSHMAEKIKVDTLAAMSHISLNHFERKFKQVFGMPPTKYIVHLRVHEAAKLLVESDMSICNIAGRVGFYDQSALTRYFVKIMGMTPSAYRRQNQGS